MKNFFNFLQPIPNKAKAIYLIWFSFNFILLLISGNGLSKIRADFYPIKITRYKTYFFDQRTYDYSEFLIYILAPIFIYSIILLWRKKWARITSATSRKRIRIRYLCNLKVCSTVSAFLLSVVYNWKFVLNKNYLINVALLLWASA